MRVWDIHPGYLSRQSLLGQHVEIHAIYSIICGEKKGYALHPETLRWKENLKGLRLIHDITVKEMTLRGYKHASPCESEGPVLETAGAKTYVDRPIWQFELLRQKYLPQAKAGRIPLPRTGFEFWTQHRYSVMGRGYQYYKQIEVYMRERKDIPISKADELVTKVMGMLELDSNVRAVRDLTDHIWGCLKGLTAADEKERFAVLKAGAAGDQFDYLFQLAQKYQQFDLLHSTVFADLI